MNTWITRLVALVLHALASILLVTYAVNYDITARWLTFISFIVLLLLMLFLFVKHLISFYYYIKNKTK